jgi:hypothetical protein
VGNVIHISAGTHFVVGWYEIISVASNAATLDRNCCTGGAGTAGSGYLGGALASPGQLGALIVGSNKAWIKAGTYTISSASTNVSNGCPSITVTGTAAAPTKIEGYQTTRGDLGTKPVLTASLAITNIIAVSGTYLIISNLTLDGSASLYASAAVNDSSGVNVNVVAYCKVQNIGGYATAITSGTVLGCVVTSPQTYVGIQCGLALFCEVYGVNGIGVDVSILAHSCIASGNGAAGFYSNTSGITTFINCTAYGNTGDGFEGNGPVVQCENCYAESNGGYGFDAHAASMILINCAGYGNTSGAYTSSGIFSNVGFVTLSGTAFVNASSGNFALNNNQGGLLKAAGYPATFPRGLTANYRDIGAAQSTIQVGTVG